MFRKRMIAIIAIGMSGLVACTPNTTTKPQESVTPQETTTVNNDESTSAEEGTSAEYDNTSDVYGRVDVEDICKHIMINGKQVDFPWTLNELGDEYEFRTITDTDETDGVCASTLNYNGKIGPRVIIYERDEVDRESIISQIWLSMYEGVQLYDFDFYTSVNEVKEKLGEPDKVSEDQFYLYYFYFEKNFELTIVFEKDLQLLDDFILKILEVE